MYSRYEALARVRIMRPASPNSALTKPLTIAVDRRFGAPLQDAHHEDRLTKFETLIEAAIDLDRIPDDYMICASYDANLEVRAPVCAAFCNRLEFPGESALVNRSASDEPWYVNAMSHETAKCVMVA